MHLLSLPPSLTHTCSKQRGTPPEEATEKNNNQPHIVWFTDADEDEPLHQYFISVEHNLMMECSNIVAAIFYCVAAHYIFNLSYHPITGKVNMSSQYDFL